MFGMASEPSSLGSFLINERTRAAVQLEKMGHPRVKARSQWEFRLEGAAPSRGAQPPSRPSSTSHGPERRLYWILYRIPAPFATYRNVWWIFSN